MTFNASGRSQISYASSDIDDSAAPNTAPLTSTIAETPAGPYSYTAEKRQAQVSADDHGEPPSKKRKRKKNKGKGQSQGNGSGPRHPHLDPTFGQTGAFPMLTPGELGADEYDVEEDGMKYLASVRNEAMGLAPVVRAPNEEEMNAPAMDYGTYEDYDEYDEAYGDDEYGYYDDGAYIGKPTTRDELRGSSINKEPQTYYYDALCRRFEVHRARLRIPPIAEAVSALNDDQPITFPSTHSKELMLRTWRYHLRHTNPLPAQLACMENSTVLKLLPLLEGQMQQYIQSAESLPEVFSRWTWGLLGRLDDAGQLDTRGVGAIRSLAKNAIWMISTIRQRLSVAGPSDHDPKTNNDGGKNVVPPNAVDATPMTAQTDSGDSALQDAKARLLQTVASDEAEDSGHGHDAAPSQPMADSAGITRATDGVATPSDQSVHLTSMPDTNTLATLDMILTVAGEFYGQRDLLESRLRWSTPSQP